MQGLGKTVQVIAMVAHLFRQPAAAGRAALVVVPASLIASWCARTRAAGFVALSTVAAADSHGPLHVADSGLRFL